MKVVVLAGPESSGKSWLAAQLHARIGGLMVGEYVRYVIDQHQRDTTLADIPAIAQGQLAWEDAARAQQPPLLILDTHLLSNKLWSQALFEIYILCLYCMVVWAAMIPLFILLTVRNLVHGVIPAPRAVTRFAAEWAGTLVAIAYVLVAGSVFLRFLPAFIG